MIQTLGKRTTLLVLSFIFATFSFLVIPSYSNVYAQDSSDAVCDTLGQATGTSCASNTAEADSNATNIIKAGLNLLSFVAGIAAVAMVMLAGFKFIMSRGDAGKIESARSTALYAIIGVVIVAVSQTIVFFVVSS